MSVAKMPDGRWMVRWRENGSNRGRRFDRKSDADAWEREIRRRRQLGPLALAQLTTRASTLGEWISERWAPEHAATLEQSTRDRYADAYRLHIEPWLGDLPLTELTVGRLRSWQAERLADGVGVGTIDKARTPPRTARDRPRRAAPRRRPPCRRHPRAPAHRRAHRRRTP